jgi:hypothetical protein
MFKKNIISVIGKIFAAGRARMKIGWLVKTRAVFYNRRLIWQRRINMDPESE